MSNPDPTQQAINIMGKGCVGGGLLAGIMLAISGMIYSLLTVIGVSMNIAIVISIASGPLIGIVLLGIYAFTRPIQPATSLKTKPRRYPEDREDE